MMCGWKLPCQCSKRCWLLQYTVGQNIALCAQPAACKILPSLEPGVSQDLSMCDCARYTGLVVTTSLFHTVNSWHRKPSAKSYLMEWLLSYCPWKVSTCRIVLLFPVFWAVACGLVKALCFAVWFVYFQLQATVNLLGICLITCPGISILNACSQMSKLMIYWPRPCPCQTGKWGVKVVQSYM